MLNIGERISQLRKQKDRSQSERAKKLEVSREIVGCYERNEAEQSIEVGRLFCSVFGLPERKYKQEVDKAT